MKTQVLFVCAPGTSAFMRELFETVANAVREVGVAASVHTGAYPDASGSNVYVVVPHEFFQSIPLEDRPTPTQLERTIGFCVEHPGTASFEIGARYARSVGGVMDISDDSTAELRRRGLTVGRFELGYSPRWDAWGGVDSTARHIDITYMGTTDERRDAFLARQAEELAEWNCRLLIPPHEWMHRPRPDFLMGLSKLRHLASSKVLINLHRGDSRALEWVRALEAMSNGCVIVSEYSRHFDPLVPGSQILFADPANVASVATALLKDPARLAAIRAAAYATCRSLDMRASALRLVELAASLVSGGARGRAPLPPLTTAGELSTISTPLRLPTPPPSHLPELAGWASDLPAPLRRLHAMSIVHSVSANSGPVLEISPRGLDTAERVTAVVPVTHDAGLPGTLRSLSAQVMPVGWMLGRTPTHPARGDGPPLRRGELLNALATATTAELILVIEPGHVLFRHAVRRLIAALDRQPRAAASFGMMADAAGAELWNSLPFEPDRLAKRVYLGAPMIVRRDALALLGLFTEDPLLDGLEYHHFWCRLAEHGMHAVLEPQVIGTGVPTRPPDDGVASLVPELALEALGRAAPRLLGRT